MFTLSAVPVKFVGLLVLFLFCTCHEAVRTLRSTGPVERTSHGLHLLMAVVMLLMVPRNVWKPFSQVVPMPVTIALMALGVVWFAWRATAAHAGHRMHAIGCALMFTAMVWHLSAMQKMHSMMNHATGNHVEMSHAGHGAAGPTATPVEHHTMGGMDHSSMGHSMAPSASPSAHASMPGMDHSTMDHSAMANPEHGAMWWFAVVGLPLMAWLLYAAVKGLVVAVTRPGERLSGLNDFAMNFGMFWMSTGLLVPVLPFFKHLAF